MPRKKRDIQRAFRDVGYSERQGKGDHAVFSHPLVKRHYAVDGVDGVDGLDGVDGVDGLDGLDALRYDEKNLRAALLELAEAQGDQGRP